MENMTTKLKVIYGDCTLGVIGQEFHYIFSYSKGGLESLNKNGKEWLYTIPKPTFWRALTDNDRGSGFDTKSGMWLAADMFIKSGIKSIAIDGETIELPIAPVNNKYSNEEYAREVEITYVFETITNPVALIETTYLVNETGTITVTMNYHGKKGLPQLPLLGMRFIMPTKAVGYTYEGLSGETYPDRMAGGVPGIYNIEGMPVTPYLVPQDNGVHMKTKWLEVTRNTTLNNADKEKNDFTLSIEAIGETFAFSCLPYTAEELENARHIEELPLPRRTVLLILNKVRGVGGIDSWGSDVEEPHNIDAQKDYSFSFAIK